MGRLIPFPPKRRPRLPALWAPYLRQRGWSFAHMRMTVWAGLLLGLSAYQAMRLVPPPAALDQAAPAIEAPDPYAEARRSRAILQVQQGAPPHEAAAPETSTVLSGPVRIIDGDTFDYAGVRVRVADIDAPEVHGRCPYETDLAARATARMGALLAAGPFELHPLPDGRDEDRYGRKLRIVKRGGRSLGDVLVAEGLARTWTGQREPWCF